MTQLHEANPDIAFFLSCDDGATQRHLLKTVPNVFVQDKHSRYNSADGVVDAVVDLYLCGLANHIIAPHWSSFPDMAEALSPLKKKAETPVYQSQAAIKEGFIGRQLAQETFEWLK